jgi:hypothetical protein
VAQLAARSVDVIVQAGVPFTVGFGRGIEERIRRQIAEITDLPLVLDIRACIEAMQRLEMARVLMVAPFTDQANADVVDYVKPDAIDVAAVHRVDQAEHGGLHLLPLGAVYQIVMSAYKRAGRVDGIWLPGAALPTVAAIGALEASPQRTGGQQQAGDGLGRAAASGDRRSHQRLWAHLRAVSFGALQERMDRDPSGNRHPRTGLQPDHSLFAAGHNQRRALQKRVADRPGEGLRQRR